MRSFSKKRIVFTMKLQFIFKKEVAKRLNGRILFL
jgi:hypothetical protein